MEQGRLRNDPEIQELIEAESRSRTSRLAAGTVSGFRTQSAQSSRQTAGRSVGYPRHMRLHITVDDELVAELDQRAGSRRRSAFIAELIRRGLDDERRWDDIEASLGTIPDQGHEWDADPGEWVRQQRADQRRTG